jgi:GTP-binding protein
MSDIRNICIIAHVDHGKTTLVDHLLKQSGTFSAHEAVAERAMDTGDLERERGITISAKNAAFNYKGTKVNVVDTPGHADFGGEVERIMSMVDGAVLLVDAAEGPMPQTRFVLQQAIRQNLKIILCINKVDRPEVVGSDMIDICVNKVFDLFVELDASEEQTEFPITYACARDGWAVSNVDEVDALVAGEKKGGLIDLYDEIVKLPKPKVENSDIAQLLVANISYSDFLGGLAIGKIRSGEFRQGQQLEMHTVDDSGKAIKKKFALSKLFTFTGMKETETDKLVAGDIAMFGGAGNVSIGDTIGEEGVDVLPRIAVEEPTMRMIFAVNTGPKCGKDGKAIQSRELYERLMNETRSNVALRLVETSQPDQFYLLGRGELQFGIIIETLRREGLEIMVGRPDVLMKEDENGGKLEPYEKVVLDLPEWAAGDVTSMLQQRKGVLMSYDTAGGSAENPRVRLEVEIPTRGILGINSRYKTLTRGAGLISSESLGFREHCGEILHRNVGSLIADRTGKCTAYSLNTLQARGDLFVEEGKEVYEGMIIGESAKDNDLNVNPVRPKKLTNMRTSGSDGITQIAPPRKMPLELCIEWIDDDEWIEVTPLEIRLRKKVLQANQRSVIRVTK